MLGLLQQELGQALAGKRQDKRAKEMADYSQQLALEMWDKTNYAAQVAQMQKAGLNVGLMYKGAGSGGTTSGAGSASAAPVSSQIPAGMGMQMALQTQVAQAQIENTKAQTEKTKVETAKIAGVDTESIIAQTKATIQSITNAETQNRLMGLQEQLNQVSLNIATQTQDESIKQAETLTNKLIEETKIAAAKGEVDQKTVDTLIQQFASNLAKTKEEITSIKTGIKATEAGTTLTEAKTAESKQTTENLEQDEIYKLLTNALKASGVEPSDNAAIRIATQWLNANDISLKTLNNKMKQIAAWVRGQNGAQTAERFKEIINQ